MDENSVKNRRRARLGWRNGANSAESRVSLRRNGPPAFSLLKTSNHNLSSLKLKTALNSQTTISCSQPVHPFGLSGQLLASPLQRVFGRLRSTCMGSHAAWWRPQLPILNTWEVPFRAAGRESAGTVHCRRVWKVPCTVIRMASVFTCGDACGEQSSVLRASDFGSGVGCGVLPADCRPAAQDLPRLRFAVNRRTTAANPAIPACRASSTSPGCNPGNPARCLSSACQASS